MFQEPPSSRQESAIIIPLPADCEQGPKRKASLESPIEFARLVLRRGRLVVFGVASRLARNDPLATDFAPGPALARGPCSPRARQRSCRQRQRGALRPGPSRRGQSSIQGIHPAEAAYSDRARLGTGDGVPCFGKPVNWCPISRRDRPTVRHIAKWSSGRTRT